MGFLSRWNLEATATILLRKEVEMENLLIGYCEVGYVDFFYSIVITSNQIMEDNIGHKSSVSV